MTAVTPPARSLAPEDGSDLFGGFRIDGEMTDVKPHERGHIHDTFISRWRHDSAERRYLHQRINDTVFTDVSALMHNIERVTAHLRAKLDRASLDLVPTRDGASYLEAPSGSWRTYVYIDNTTSVDVCSGPEMAYEAAREFGWFQAELIDLDPGQLEMTSPRFFSSVYRLEQLDAAVAQDPLGRAADVADELAFVAERRPLIEAFEREQTAGSIPTRVVHGDTKLNNVLFDCATGKPVAIVDLDTCMPAYSLYDFGDLVRFTAATAREDETDLSLVEMDPALYDALAEGYLASARAFLLPREIEMMPLAAKVVTLTIGIRFLGDYIAGDVYFKTARPSHNLDRARVQMKLVESMESRLG